MGVYKEKFTHQATGAANTPTELAGTDNEILGGAVKINDVLNIHLEFSAYGVNPQGTIMPKLNGIDLFDDALLLGGNGNRLIVDLQVTRTGTTQGVVTGTQLLPGVGLFALPEKALSGLSWNSKQEISIMGQSTEEGGCILQRGGTVR